MTFERELLAAARGRLGKPFRHHFKLNNDCQFGTLPLLPCMEVGMDDSGYDCSGIVIASTCDVLGIPTKDWPTSYRHR